MFSESYAVKKSSLDNGLDLDYLQKVYDNNVYGRQIGKSVAHATFLLGLLEVNNAPFFIVTGPNYDFLNHFRLLLEQVANLMGVPIKCKSSNEMIIANHHVKFIPHQSVVQRSRGSDCIIYDCTDIHSEWFEPCYMDHLTIDEHIDYIKRMLLIRCSC